MLIIFVVLQFIMYAIVRVFFDSVSEIPSEVARISDFLKNVLTSQPSSGHNM